MNTSSDTVPDSELLTRFVRQRDEAAFARLVHQYQPLVIGAALRRTGNLECAREVAQTVFITLARRAAWLLDRQKLAGWLYQAASYQGARVWAAEQRRHRRQEQAAMLAHAVDDPSHAQWAPLEDALQSLPANDREALVLHYFQDRSYPEMAADLGLSEAAARKRVSRAVQNLGTRLRQKGAPAQAIVLLTGAAAMQSTLPAQAALAATTLTAASSASVPFMLTLTAMTSSTLIKTSVIILALATIPLAWQQNRNAVLRKQLAMLRETATSPAALNQPAKAASSANVGSQTTAHLDLARKDLAAVQAERAREEARLQALQKQARQLQDEVVVSLGKVDEVARKVADVQRLTMKLREETDPATHKALLAQLMPKMSEMAPILAEMRRISAEPELNARLNATSLAALANVSDDVRDQIQRQLLPHYQSMARKGLALDQRPRQHSADWDRRYGEATVAAMRSIEHLLPLSLRQTEMWKTTTTPASKGQTDFLDMLTRAGPPPPAPSKP